MKKIILVLFVLISVGCGNTISDKIPDGAFIDMKLDDIEVFSDMYVSDLISDTNVSIEDYKIDTDVIGNKSIEFYYTFQDTKYVYRTSVEVVDTEAPKIFGSSSRTVLVGYEGNLCNGVTYGDNYDGQPECSIEGDIDFETAGKYDVDLVVTDVSGNSTNYNVSVNVVEEIASNNNNSGGGSTSKLAFSDAYSKYKTDNTELGIDVSEWQGDIDYEAVKEAGATFVMMRIGVKLDSGEDPALDKKFLDNIKKAKEAGLKVGVYLYSKAKSLEEAIDEANWVLDTLDGESLDLPIVFDWEIWSNWNSYHLSFHDLNEMPKAFIKTVEDAGYEGMLYGSKFYLENFWDGTYDNVWLAHYASSTDYEGYMMWQFSNIGRIDGIYGDVDLNVMVVD